MNPQCRFCGHHHKPYTPPEPAYSKQMMEHAWTGKELERINAVRRELGWKQL